MDYQQHSHALSNLSVWDAITRIEKVRKTKKQKQIDFKTKEVHETMLEQETMNAEADNMCSIDKLLLSTTRKRPAFNLLSNHLDSMTHTHKICPPIKRMIPVPIGPAITRRDHEPVKERYARLMLILFKPWQHAHDL